MAVSQEPTWQAAQAVAAGFYWVDVIGLAGMRPH